MRNLINYHLVRFILITPHLYLDEVSQQRKRIIMETNQKLIVKDISYQILRYLADFGDNAGRYIYCDVRIHELIDMHIQKIDIEYYDELREQIKTQLKQAWQNIIN